MIRTVAPTEAAVLERLELERPELVTTSDLTALLDEFGIGTLPRVFAARLRAKGWLLPTDQCGVWEFAPAALAGPYSSNNSLLPLRSFLTRHPDTQCGLTFQAAAWAHGLAERVPVRPEIAVADAVMVRRLPGSLDASAFAPVLPYAEVSGVPVLAVESVIVHMCVKPNAVRSWASAAEWLPDLAAEASVGGIKRELAERPRTVAIRTGYLLQSMRPDIADRIAEVSPMTGKTRFGSRSHQLRYDSRWQVIDTLLPFEPRSLESVA